MKRLFKAACRVRRHFLLFPFILITLIGLTLANQVEMFAFGMLAGGKFDLFPIPRGEEHAIPLRDEHSREKGENLLQRLVDRYSPLRKNLKSLIGVLLFIALFKGFFLFFSRYTAQLLSIRISRDLRQSYFDHMQTLPMSFYQKHDIGSLASRVTGDSDQIARSIHSFIAQYLHAPFTILSTLSLCFYLSWQLSSVIFIGLPMVIWPIVFVTRNVRRIARQLQKKQERFLSILVDFLSGVQTIKMFAMERFSLKKYGEQNLQMARLEKKTAKYDLLTRPVLHAATTFCLAAVMIVGLYILKIDLSRLIVFVGLLYQFYEPIKKFSEENVHVQKGIVAADRMYAVLELRPQIVDCPSSIPLREFREEIAFDRVWFRYEKEWVLKDLTFSVKKGETVALVGSSGGGKSTIVQLIPRLYDVQKGEIRIDGRSIREYTQKSLREEIACVPQIPFIFQDTILANIAYGNPYSREEVIRAAKRAHAHEFIEGFPDLYDTLLAESGKNLSGGQQQRIAIARALIKNAPILILDEPTSSLDSISESRIKMAVQELLGNVTKILIAHRFSTIEFVDRIIYIERGRKIAEGSRDELLLSCPPFKRMWDNHYALRGE